MKKLINGIVTFHKTLRPEYRETFARLALEQTPDTLFIACSDSRVVPNLFASADPGDLFVVRNVGNLIPPCGNADGTISEESEWAAIEFSVLRLGVRDIVVCGHSECGAMKALWQGREQQKEPHLRSWLRYGEAALERLKNGDPSINQALARHNQLSQLNVIEQLKNLSTYTILDERLKDGRVRLHAWWFDIQHADVYAYDDTLKKFILIDEHSVKQILAKLPD
jgi:carbonic anhydrase